MVTRAPRSYEGDNGAEGGGAFRVPVADQAAKLIRALIRLKGSGRDASKNN
jgi:hypothetical protein